MTVLRKPKGAKTKAPVVSLMEARRAMQEVKRRAAEDSAEDQRLLVQMYLEQGRAPFAFLGWQAYTDGPRMPGLLSVEPKGADHDQAS